MPDLHRTIDAVWRMESPKLIARLARMVRDVGQAEDWAQDALVAALEAWPRTGLPDNPGAWLMTAAKNRALDGWRRQKNLNDKLQQYGRDRGDDLDLHRPDFDAPFADTIEDDLLSLVFTACHPVLSAEARVALTLKVLGGLSTGEIARAYLVSETTMAQRLVRAKRTLSEARVPFEAPEGPERMVRLASVLEVLYLMFNEGYSASSGEQWTRPLLCEEALRLGRIVTGLMPEASEAHGLSALMELQASRLGARVAADGSPVLLLDQDRGRWDQLLIRRGLGALARAERRAAATGSALGPYALQAAIAACHARAHRPEETDWERIAAVYDALGQIQPSPVIELNRGVATAMAYGPAAGLEIIDPLLGDPALVGYYLLPSVRGDLLAKLGLDEEAAAEFERAASLAGTERERRFLKSRASALREAP